MFESCINYRQASMHMICSCWASCTDGSPSTSRARWAAQAKTVQATGDLCRRHRKDFLQLHTCSEAERDRIEAEIGQYIKSCTANIARLEAGVPQPNHAGASGPAARVTASTAAHCHGVVRSPFSAHLQFCNSEFPKTHQEMRPH